MALPDTFERAGIVVGAVLLGAIAVAPVAGVVLAPHDPLWKTTLVLCLPGAVAGWLVATDRVPVSYTQFWRFALVAGIGSIALYAAAGLNTSPIQDATTAVVLWAVALAGGAVVANYESVLARLR